MYLKFKANEAVLVVLKWLPVNGVCPNPQKLLRSLTWQRRQLSQKIKWIVFWFFFLIWKRYLILITGYIPIIHCYSAFILKQVLQNLGLCLTFWLMTFVQGNPCCSVVTWDLGLYGLIRRTASFSRLLQQAKGIYDPFKPCSPQGFWL